VSTVLVERRGPVALVTLNRPEALNAVNDALRGALTAALGELNRDPEVRAVVLTGAGERSFCAGQDLAEARAIRVEDVDAWLERQHAMYQAVRDLDVPCVAALNGVATGAGFQIGLCADLRIGYPELAIGQPEVRIGVASIVGSYLMTLHVGLGHNVQLSLGGELLTGQRAYEIGLLSRLAPRAEVLATALAAAAGMAASPPTAVRLTKQRLRALTQPGFDAALVAAKAAQRQAYASGEPQAAIAHFFAQRATRRATVRERGD
jgi:enoyl-CoA hydratase/carnithine racemase